METKMRRQKMENIRHKLGYSNMFVVDCVGKSGGLGLLWGEGVVVDIQNYSHRHINSVVHDENRNIQWKFTGFYGHPETPKRHEAWALLKHLARIEPRPWMCIGDFNEIINGTEKLGGNERNQRQMRAFYQTLEECGLDDMGYHGPKFTWSNCQEGMDLIKERLDRGVANREWRDLFPEAAIMVEAATTSDHAPLFLNLKKFIWRGKRKRQFRFEACWGREKGCQEVISAAWNKVRSHAVGWTSLEEKIDVCMKEIKKWKASNVGPILGNANKLREDLLALQGREDAVDSEFVKKLKTEIQTQLEKEDIWWRQRAKSEWLKHGDRNTKYFHACANSRRKKNRIEKIRDEQGIWWKSQEEVGLAFVNYYKGLFIAGREEEMGPSLQNIQPAVTQGMNEELGLAFTEEEVHAALHQMAPLKAPGPDGLNACFFQQNWTVMQSEVCKGILEILNSGIMPRSLNMTHIALIPKNKNPECVNEFRPISLCNVLYKLVSKVLANRLKKILPSVISPTQSAFIPGRLITDNLLAAYETLHTMHTKIGGKKGYMAVKIDMSKAYDRVEWRFLEAVMRKMGFRDGWIKLVMMCVTSVQYSVIVNGEPCGLFSPTRGLRQGDPISPYLFLICAEALSSMVTQANREGLLSGVPTSRRGPNISHLFFADDSVFFCRATLAQWSNLSAILHSYEVASGQKMNASKTAIFFSKNTPSAEKETIVEFAGISATNRYDRYLGLPALVGRSRTKAFRSIVEKVKKRLQDWKLRFLSQAGKEILVKAVVQAIPSYCMSVFLFPKTLSLEINSLMQGFWWGHKERDRRIPWMSWSKMGMSKTLGGMGFRDLTCFNKALLAKQVWRMWSTPNSLIARIMKYKYFPECSILEASIRDKPSFAWRSIQSACELLKEGLVWRIGNGKKAKVWQDKWVPKSSTGKVFSAPRILDQNATVCELFDASGRSWNQFLLDQLFSVEEGRNIRTIPISLSNQEDRLIWRGTAKGVFSVKSAYHLQKELENSQLAENSSRRQDSVIWKYIWKLNIPNTEKVFFWRACQNILPTRENLKRRKIITDAKCLVCEREVESTAHILWHCLSTQDVWGGASIIFQKSQFQEDDFFKIAEGMMNRCTMDEFQHFVVMTRRIWLRRNKLLHEGIFSHPDSVVSHATEALREYHQVQAATQSVETPAGPPPTGKWEAPPLGWHKVNWDAALGKQQGRMGSGVVVRDHLGRVVAARSVTRQGDFEPAAAEAMAAFLAMQTAHEMGIQTVWFEGDAKEITNAVNSRTTDWSPIGHLVDDLRLELSKFPTWKMTHVRRENNQAAHMLARRATSEVMDHRWTHCFPDCINETIVAELYALAHECVA
jgi:ribonuclease HI